MYCPNCGREVAEGKNFCAGCGAAMNPEVVSQPGETLQPQPQHPMKWFKYLIYFGLFAGALVNLVNGLNMLTGDVYGEMEYIVYRMFSGLKALDVMVGLLMIALAVFSVVVRFRLAKFHKNAPKLLMALYIAAAAVTLVHAVGAQAIVSGFAPKGLLDTSTEIGSIIGSIAAVIINGIYFKKRSYLFVNE